MVPEHRSTSEENVRWIPCQAVGKSPSPEPLGKTKMPEGPWEVVHTDFYGPLPNRGIFARSNRQIFQISRS
jgi:hypothetical protein